ncbi:hypothetical protein A2767_07040 [Candidatus Roizmanbacteria bacterium RIFCSPHIGHO2_01_FULL_35_10]|uniref:Uncharacterized protein n=1 Tax=Candidatus Roizmanbacteria bacterium RIFCSPLOWO2_01_FULL_35_13 TaxID=1802055 RepID=A0A1F7IFD9_9BACT|nr:MAG: hypothetical protein A2767_07040 [Candidatus Roizmanbacteria bacterium RIFCSPHIGHO2_01_FULL_35_10]OGK42050.1 MAG: hypothetical protein A3A74_00205 [Candidatus Roizmanbacteria bacterium RIFCSPLOWO2_01_FULL_35_13]
MTNLSLPQHILHFCNDHRYIFLIDLALNEKRYCPVDGKRMNSKKVSSKYLEGWKSMSEYLAKENSYPSHIDWEYAILTNAKFNILTGESVNTQKGIEQK